MNDRWKCPDCHGWVAQSVLVHYCASTNVPGQSYPRWPHQYDQTSPMPIPFKVTN